MRKILDREVVIEEASSRGLPISCWRTSHLLDENVLYLKGEIYWLDVDDNGGMDLIILQDHKFLLKKGEEGADGGVEIERYRFGSSLYQKANDYMRLATGAFVTFEPVDEPNPVMKVIFKIDVENATDTFMKLLDTSAVLKETRIPGCGGRMGDIRKGKYRMAIPVWEFPRPEPPLRRRPR